MTKWSKRKISFPRGPSEAWQRYPSQEAPVKHGKDILPKRPQWSMAKISFPRGPSEAWQRYPSQEAQVKHGKDILPKRPQWSNTKISYQRDNSQTSYQWGCAGATLSLLPMKLYWSNTEASYQRGCSGATLTNEVVLEQHWGILPMRLLWSWLRSSLICFSVASLSLSSCVRRVCSSSISFFICASEAAFSDKASSSWLWKQNQSNKISEVYLMIQTSHE